MVEKKWKSKIKLHQKSGGVSSGSESVRNGESVIVCGGKTNGNGKK